MMTDKPLICECVADDAYPVLRAVLDAFNGQTEGTSDPMPYISLDGIESAMRKYGRGPVALILNLLDRLGYVEHYGNLTCSSALTDKGRDLRDSLREEPT